MPRLTVLTGGQELALRGLKRKDGLTEDPGPAPVSLLGTDMEGLDGTDMEKVLNGRMREEESRSDKVWIMLGITLTYVFVGRSKL